MVGVHGHADKWRHRVVLELLRTGQRPQSCNSRAKRAVVDSEMADFEVAGLVVAGACSVRFSGRWLTDEATWTKYFTVPVVSTRTSARGKCRGDQHGEHFYQCRCFRPGHHRLDDGR